MYSKGTSVKEIAEIYNTRVQQVCKLVKGQRHQRLLNIMHELYITKNHR